MSLPCDGENEILDDGSSSGSSLSETETESAKDPFELDEPSDVTIVFGSQRLALHKHILTSKSDYFRALFAGNFKESNASEIDLQGDDEEALKRALTALYTIDDTLFVSEEQLGLIDNDFTTEFEALFKVADKYGMVSTRKAMIRLAVITFINEVEEDDHDEDCDRGSDCCCVDRCEHQPGCKHRCALSFLCGNTVKWADLSGFSKDMAAMLAVWTDPDRRMIPKELKMILGRHPQMSLLVIRRVWSRYRELDQNVRYLEFELGIGEYDDL